MTHADASEGKAQAPHDSVADGLVVTGRRIVRSAPAVAEDPVPWRDGRQERKGGPMSSKRASKKRTRKKKAANHGKRPNSR